ncbi:homeobox-leucine zipper protein HOX15 [Brachypodium distachyon]|uniref:Homeobox domain-containing protein n=1 Tax=Brachypodium distachyon TaxID=15368 RepID=I1I334_BRADI|nr:homeobox-leucine zipper protein HOX15 [Brachypodium distachyon]KQJ96197.1 hypothetical protein BRADI_3g21480v3 [Brachypodium distachyon]|eukprot:XP_003571682.1 homeobox-leucine zipper protein HOX15 [Brachypodium distachyon]
MLMAAQEEVAGLALDLSLGSAGGHHRLQQKEASAAPQQHCALPSLTLSLQAGAAVKREAAEEEEEEDERAFLYYSAASSAADDDVVDREAGCNGSSRKKLRLTKEQSALLEDRFKEHSTLNPKQKAVLARQLNLRPRQVEVWFQNRRARTKLKQTEVDCEVLKRCCETLTEENRRLHRELNNLRAIHHHHSAFFVPAAATLSVCPSCDRLAATGAPPASVVADRPAAKRSFFATKSAAC